MLESVFDVDKGKKIQRMEESRCERRDKETEESTNGSKEVDEERPVKKKLSM